MQFLAGRQWFGGRRRETPAADQTHYMRDAGEPAHVTLENADQIRHGSIKIVQYQSAKTLT
jgi:hypothetical protein